MRLDQKDPAVLFLKAELPFLELEQDAYNKTQVLFSYPTQAPAGGVVATFKEEEHDKSSGVGSSSSSEEQDIHVPLSSDSRSSLAGSVDGAVDGAIDGKRKRTVTLLDGDDTQMQCPAAMPVTAIRKLTKPTPPRTMSAIEQLELWLAYSDNWCEHKPSISVYVEDTPQEWLKVGQWIWSHFEVCSGLSFFPKDLGTYKQAPYEAITYKQYVQRAVNIPKSVDWSRMTIYEQQANDALVSSHREALSCTAAGGCEG